MIRDSFCFYVPFLMAFAMASPASSDWIYWEGNGHLYQAVKTEQPISWLDAAMRANDMGGYLATITSIEENSFVFSLIDAPDFWTEGAAGRNYGPWIGGYQGPEGSEPDGGWTWITDEPFSYSSWNNGEPNDDFLGEDYLHFFSFGFPLSRGSTWNDLPNAGQGLVSGFVVEAVPEASSFVMLAGVCGLGAAGQLIRRRRSRSANGK